MKIYAIAAVVLCALAGVAVIAANAPDKKPETPATKPATQPTTKPGKVVNKFCPVERDNPVDPTVPTYVYKGKTIGFCCEDCLPKFKKDPDTYMKDLK